VTPRTIADAVQRETVRRPGRATKSGETSDGNAQNGQES
jgi:hypothetical protein